MGQEINSDSFNEKDEALFKEKLRDETKILKRWFDEKKFDPSLPKCGLELEAWLVNEDFVPAPESHEFLDCLNHPFVVPEISKFNFELNSNPYVIKENVFQKLEDEINETWEKCSHCLEDFKLHPLTIGTLPTLRDHMLTLEHLSPQKRYFALNKRVMSLRENQPIVLDIEGKDWIHIERPDVITECAATSLQIHFGVSQETAAKYYNASIVASSFIAAACANSPYFYGQRVWDESRIPIFEQSVNLRSFRGRNGEAATRVSLGNGYVRGSIFELFLENLNGYSVLLPEVLSTKAEELAHLRLHNGTIWRWNRPLIGFSENGTPSLRLEFRVPSAGPTISDAIANMAFQIGLVQALFEVDNLETQIPFEVAKENFYSACKYGLNAQITWLNGCKINLQELLYNELVPMSVNSLKKLQISDEDIQKYIHEIIHPRVQSGQNGANWQKAYVSTHGYRFQEMLEMYYSYQKENIPVHKWKA